MDYIGSGVPWGLCECADGTDKRRLLRKDLLLLACEVVFFIIWLYSWVIEIWIILIAQEDLKDADIKEILDDLAAGRKPAPGPR